MKKVSIIVPVYNVEAYLRECMDSITRQTLKEIEIVCVNDGSKDGSRDILREYEEKDERVIVIDQENGGYGKAMNNGLDHATGEYIGIVEPDDYVPLNMYEDLYAAAKENALDFVKADFYRFMTDPETEDMTLVYNHLDSSGTYYGKVYNPRRMPVLTSFIMNTWSGIYSRAFIEKYHIRHHETPGASFQDNGFFWQTFIYAERAMFIRKPYYMNRRDNPNSSVNSPEKVYCMNVEYDYIKGIFMQPENQEIWDQFKGYYNLKRFHNYSFTIRRIADSYKREYVERISREFKRSEELGELDWSVFKEKERDRLRMLISHPEDYYLKYCLYDAPAKQLMKSQKRVKELEESTTYKVGKIVMFIPISIKKGLKKMTGKKG